MTTAQKRPPTKTRTRKHGRGGATQMPMSPDPKNPMRYMMRLSQEEQVAFNQEVSTRTTERSQQCTSQQQGPAERPIQAGGLVDKSKSPANKNAVAPADDRRNRPPPPGGPTMSPYSFRSSRRPPQSGGVGTFR